VIQGMPAMLKLFLGTYSLRIQFLEIKHIDSCLICAVA